MKGSKESTIPTCKAQIGCYHSLRQGSHKAAFKVYLGGQLWRGKGTIPTQVGQTLWKAHDIVNDNYGVSNPRLTLITNLAEPRL